MPAADRPTTAQRLRVAHLNPRLPTGFDLAPDEAARAAIAADLGLEALPALRFHGEVRAAAGESWQLDGRLTARVVQPCVVTLAPVETPLDEPVRRLYSPHLGAPAGEETEMPDDALEPLGQFIDPGEVMREALALALPLYPRAAGAALDAPPEGSAAGTETGDAPATRRPFAGLADLIDRRGPGKPS